ncbi:MAG: DUF4340 domain-containing protein [Kiritimatiellae bacterium]|nr:DUF4340 domain-containing protein [Kiritimatiellia bacterium]
MNRNKLILLAAAAVILGLAAVMSNNSKRVKTPPETGQLLLPQLDLTKVQRVEFQQKDGAKLTVASTDTGWIIPSLYGYPADITKIRERLLMLKEIKIGGSAPLSRVENADLLDLQDSAGKSLAALRIGEQRSREATGQMAMYGGGPIPDGRYLSLGGTEKAYLVKETLSNISASPANWADTEIINIPSADINGIAIMQGGNAVILSKKESGWEMAGLSEKEEFDTSKSYSLESALSYLSFNTLADPAMSADDLGLTTGTVFKATLKNGESYTASIGNQMPGGSERYMKITAVFTPQGTNETINAGLKAKIDTFNERTSKWNYVIPSHKADSMLKTRADFVKIKEEEKPETEPELKSEEPQ